MEKFLMGVVNKIDYSMITDRKKDEYLQHDKLILKGMNTITMDNGDKIDAEFEIDFKEGDYIGFAVSKKNKVKYFVNQHNAEKLKDGRKFDTMSKFNIFMQFFSIITSILNINANLNLEISYFLLSSSLILLVLNSYIFFKNKKERKNINNYLKSIPFYKKESHIQSPKGCKHINV